jgi:hypothetical protein
MDMDKQSREELMREKRIEKLIRKEEYEEAMSKLPINERAIIKEVLLQIRYANNADRRYKRERELQLAKQNTEQLKQKSIEAQQRLKKGGYI